MSDYETHKGTLKETTLTKEKIVQIYLATYQGINKWLLGYKDKMLSADIINEIFQELEDYVQLNDKIYKIQDTILDSDEDICEMDKTSDGLEYFVAFYNGGCSFEEALQDAYSELQATHVQPNQDELNTDQIEDNINAYVRGEQEGWSYAVTGYTDGKEFKDPKTRKLWKEAGDAINKLRNYILDFYNADPDVQAYYKK